MAADTLASFLDWTLDKEQTLKNLSDYWNSSAGQAQMQVIMASQNAEFSYSHKDV